jgi:CO/xanthine dehydrogenase Mo-binding subunit
MIDRSQIGDSIIRVDALAKVTGKQVYPSDFYLDGILHLAVCRSPYPHAEIGSIDISAAEKSPGVVKIITAVDIPGELMTGLMIPDMPVLCKDIVRRQGDPIAIVAAEIEDQAKTARDLIEVEYEVLPVVDDPRKALEKNAPKIHPGGNLVSEIHLEQGDIDKAFQEADQVFEFEYQSGRQEHAFLETEGGVAYYDEEGRLTIRFGGQHPHWDCQIIAGVLGIDAEKVRVISPMVGGSFGGKDDIDVQVYLALVTYLTKRPCRIWYSRKESLVAGNKRHPYTSIYKTACDQNGMITAAQITFYSDTGAYAGWGDKVLNTTIGECFGPYQIPNSRVDAYCVYTNNSNASAFRGFGGPQGVFPLESQIDHMARAYGIDPLDFREMNLVKKGETTPLGVKYKGDWSIREVISEARFTEIYKNRELLLKAEEPHKQMGIGLAAAIMGIGYGAGVPDWAEIQIDLTLDGRYRMHIGGTDMGQGNSTALMQIAAHELNCSLEMMDLVLGDSLGPDAGSCDAARQVTFVGRAAVAAAIDLRHKILQEAENELESSLENLRLTGHEILETETGRKLPLKGLGEIIGIGQADIPDIEAVMDGLPAHLYTTGVQLALVEVDLETGQVDLLRFESVIDAGKVINQQGIEGQTEGGIIQGIGYALFEDTIIDSGIVQTDSLSTYLIPTCMDVPPVLKTHFIEVPSELGPYGAKGIAEIVLVPTAPAITNAVADAIGERFTKIPLRAEDIKRRLIELED